MVHESVSLDLRKVMDEESGQERNINLTGFDGHRNPEFRPDFETTLDGIFDIDECLRFRDTLTDAAGDGWAIDDPNSIFIAVDGDGEKHGSILVGVSFGIDVWSVSTEVV